MIPVIIDVAYPENFPCALRYELADDGALTDRPVTILGPDIRETGDGKLRGLAKVVAGLIGVDTDEIVRRAGRDHRLRLKNMALGLSAVVVALTGLLIWAEINREIAVRRYRWGLTQR